MYQINIDFKNEKHQLSIAFENDLLKKWQGKFAELIIREIIYNIYHQEDSFLLCKDHLCVFLHRITMLYRSAIVCHDIEPIIEPLKLNLNEYNIAEVILLNINIHDAPLDNDDLISILIDDFPDHNFLRFYQVIEILLSHKIIEKIDRGSHQIFYRKNISENQNYTQLNDSAHINDQATLNSDVSITLL